ncbi:MAG: O-antigen ligase family protein, partial [Bacteroides sp.]|nr:O-antigen ligase family protein [Bacteroides sp.]
MMKKGVLVHIITIYLLLLGGYEALLGFRQLYGFSVSNHSLYALTGSFYNPGPYMGYLAMVLPVCVYVYVSRCTQILRSAQDDTLKETSINVIRYSAGAVGLMILCLLPSGMSRSAWVAAIVSVGYVMAMHHREKLSMFFRNHWKGVLMGGAVLAVLACGAYHLKKDSADGRLLMWKVAARAVCERPWTGYGWESVAGAYGDAQEAYFANGDYTATEAHVAGSPEYVFNEYLQVAMAWGVPVLVICLLVLVGGWCIAHRRKQYGL